MKAKTYREWRKTKLIREGSDEDAYAESAWTAAQDAMFEHADGELPLAVRVPPVEEWPDYAVSFVGAFSHSDGVHMYEAVKLGEIVLRRPAPKWVPKVGDVVFVDNTSTVAIIRVVDGFTPDRIKPFDASKIGLPWDQL